MILGPWQNCYEWNLPVLPADQQLPKVAKLDKFILQFAWRDV